MGLPSACNRTGVQTDPRNRAVLATSRNSLFTIDLLCEEFVSWYFAGKACFQALTKGGNPIFRNCNNE